MKTSCGCWLLLLVSSFFDASSSSQLVNSSAPPDAVLEAGFDVQTDSGWLDPCHLYQNASLVSGQSSYFVPSLMFEWMVNCPYVSNIWFPSARGRGQAASSLFVSWCFIAARPKILSCCVVKRMTWNHPSWVRGTKGWKSPPSFFPSWSSWSFFPSPFSFCTSRPPREMRHCQ